MISLRRSTKLGRMGMPFPIGRNGLSDRIELQLELSMAKWHPKYSGRLRQQLRQRGSSRPIG